jgi:uncharacterized Zn-finger protein
MLSKISTNEKTLFEILKIRQNIWKYKKYQIIYVKVSKRVKVSIKSESQEKERNSFINGLSHHLKNGKFKCDYNECNKSYKTKESLKVHQRLDTGIKFFCIWPQCKYGTIYRNKLKRHAFTHKEVRNFKCDFQNCNKVFKRNDCLKAHKLIDSSERKFICDWNHCLIN